MSKLNKFFLIGIVLFCVVSKAFCATNIWNNDLRNLFLSNKAIIYAVNIRTFNAKDTNKDGIIDESAGEERGNFLNAIKRLDELSNAGVNVIQLLPITPVGKVKALGTAGSLYAVSSFNELNPQLKSPKNDLTIDDEMRKFVRECHKRDIRVIVDLPCCASYDLYLKHPELFKKDKDQNPIIPSDWTDVRLLDSGDEDEINIDVYNMYIGFVDMVMDIGVDGIRANIPSIKPYSFWKKLINDAKVRDSQFLFIAESSTLSDNPAPEYISITPLNKLLEAGFDGYYGNYDELKNWQTSKDLMANVKNDLEISKKYSSTKKVLANFATHDQISPILVNGPKFSELIIWLNATLPLNSYYIDGFSTGDNFIYPWANKKAGKTFTDDGYYFVHRGQMDIFNFSRKPRGDNTEIYRNFLIANRFKVIASNIISQGTFVPLKTSAPSVFAYARCYDNTSVIVIGNLNFKKTQNVMVKVPRISPDLVSVPIKLQNIPNVLKGKITTMLAPGEVQVLMFESLELK